MLITKEHNNFKKFLGYIFCAGVATLVDIFILYLMTEIINLWYFYSAIFSYLCGMLTNYFLNKYLNFKNLSKKIIKQFSLFILVALVGLLINQTIIYYLVEFKALNYIIAKILSVGIVMFWSFYAHMNITFKIYK